MIATEMASFGLEDLLLHFKARRGFEHGKSWMQFRDGKMLRSRCDYLLGTDRRMFSNVCLRDPRLFTSDHYLILGELQSTKPRGNLAYLKARRKFPLRPPKGVSRTNTDVLFQEIQRFVPPPNHATMRERKEWISHETWALVDQRSALRKQVYYDQALARRLKLEIN